MEDKRLRDIELTLRHKVSAINMLIAEALSQPGANRRSQECLTVIGWIDAQCRVLRSHMAELRERLK